MDSILTSIKKLLGIEEEYTHFDPDIIIGINSAFMALNQIGIGPTDGFSITSGEETWASYLETAINLEAVKSYIFLRTRLLFDPPTTAGMIEAVERQMREYEWRLMAQVDKFVEEVVPEEV